MAKKRITADVKSWLKAETGDKIDTATDSTAAETLTVIANCCAAVFPGIFTASNVICLFTFTADTKNDGWAIFRYENSAEVENRQAAIGIREDILSDIDYSSGVFIHELAHLVDYRIHPDSAEGDRESEDFFTIVRLLTGFFSDVVRNDITPQY